MIQIFDIIHGKNLDDEQLIDFSCFGCGLKPQSAIFFDYDIEGNSIYICPACINKLTELRKLL